MAEERARQGAAQAAGVETDAVCERCGTVNPEETLLCKSCGNNLREQRSRRLAAAQAYQGIEEAKPRTRWFTGLLAVFGLLIILWTALNVGQIEEWLAEAQTDAPVAGEDFYSGPRAAMLNQLAAELNENPVTREEADIAMAQTANPPDIGGRYAILRRGLAGADWVGQAVVRRQGDDFLFVAQLRNGVALRGVGRLREGTDTVVAENAAIEYQNEFAEASGAVQPIPGIGYAIFGITSLSDDSYEGVAYAIPEDAVAAISETAATAEPAAPETATPPETPPAEPAPTDTTEPVS